VRVLVTGAGGYVGRAVVSALSFAGHDAVALVRRDDVEVPGAAARHVGDVRSADALGEALRGVDAVCHLAGLTRARDSWAESARYFEVNAGGTAVLLRAMEAAGVQRLAFASTGAIYGSPEVQPMSEDLADDPPHPYAASKVAAEAAIYWQARTTELAATVLRLFNVAGGIDPDPTRIVPRVLAAVRAGRPLEVNGDGSAVRDYVHVVDAAEAFVAAVEHRSAVGTAERYNVGSGYGTSVLEVIGAAQLASGGTVQVVHKPAAAESQRLVSDPGRALAELGWKPRRSSVEAIVRDAWIATGPA
jgi:nucleoside-diphosphate-sugar epimerase